MRENVHEFNDHETSDHDANHSQYPYDSSFL